MKLIVMQSVLGLAGLVAVTSLTTDEPPAPAQDGAKVAEYVGAEKCRKCHRDQHKSWKKTKMANVFEHLKPGVSTEAKTKAGLDPKKDYTRDETCLPCHTTGYGEPGGYQIPPEGNSPEAIKAQKRAAALEGVQCESCHGPASLVIEHKEKNEEYKWDDLVAKKLLSGVIFPDKEVCVKCHNPKSPFVAEDYKFDFEEKKDEGTHEHFPMDFDHSCPHDHSVSKKKRKRK